MFFNELPTIHRRYLRVFAQDDILQFYAEMAYHNPYGIELVNYETYKKMLEETPACLDKILMCQTQVCIREHEF